MMEFTIRAAKQGFFDSPKVMRAVSRAKRKVFSKFGAFVRTRARTSIKQAPRRLTRTGRKSKAARVSRPGRPPLSHRGLLRKFILFAWDASRQSVVIGPAKLNSTVDSRAPAALEYGGRSTARDRRKARQIRVRARPFMRPAFAAEKPKLRDLWRGSVK